MDTLFKVELTLDQRSLLTAIAHPWLNRGEWPLWANIQHHFDMRGQDADAIFHSLPRVGLDAPYAAGYGFTTPMRAPISANDRVRLTMAASIKLNEVRMAAGEPFVQALRHMIDLYTSRPMHFETVPTVMLRSGELADALPHLKPWFVKVLPDLINVEPLLSGSGAGLGDGSWEREVTRSVLQYRGVSTVEEYVEKTCEIVFTTAGQYGTPAIAVAPPAAALGRGPYVDLALLDDLEQAAAGTKWKVHKLIALCQGLNDAYKAGNPYVCAAMIRAVMDHIPPVFGQPDFKQVASQHTFKMKQTDKAHAQFLANYKTIGDDVMHRPIGLSVPVITMDDIPTPIRLNAVLREMVTLL
ncbi:hypothetical protein [Streptomyces sp. L2]|uniref:hypothetical protein n=1 Tax=Streptomyces sp. L2 TaxID=2162665 RepID=UPI00101395EE|nr:hypothetical protein [Streptomyces sp. L2]